MQAKQERHTHKARISALRILEQNNFDYQKTAKLTGFSCSTIKKWEKQFGAEVFTGKPPEEVTFKAINIEVKMNDSLIMRKLYNIRNQLLDIIQELISLETKLEPLVNTLQSISIDIGIIDEMDKKESVSMKGSSFEELLNSYIEEAEVLDMPPDEDNYVECGLDED
jgi:transcriptional regulator with XRE-family HTH domain